MFRTPIGFHDAYVAAPSQKAALAAWGSDANLFARGMAEVVTDPALTAEPLARPGEVVRRLRGSEAEQIAALGEGAARKKKVAGSRIKSGMTKEEDKPSPQPSPASGRGGEEEDRPSPRPSSARSAPGTPARFGPASGRGRGGEGRPTPGPSRKREGRKAPRPSRAGVEKTELALARAEGRHRGAVAKLRAEEEAIERRRRALEDKYREERERLTQAVDEARETYRAAMAKWAE